MNTRRGKPNSRICLCQDKRNHAGRLFFQKSRAADRLGGLPVRLAEPTAAGLRRHQGGNHPHVIAKTGAHSGNFLYPAEGFLRLKHRVFGGIEPLAQDLGLFTIGP